MEIRCNLKEIAGEYQLNAAKCAIRALSHVTHVEVKPVQKLGLKAQNFRMSV
jgi:hypothetical protein